MIFEAYNHLEHRDFVCKSIKCIPTINQLQLMNKVGYKFRLDGKIVSINQLKKYINEE